jgi:molybdate transport system substrate-binding protein
MKTKLFAMVVAIMVAHNVWAQTPLPASSEGFTPRDPQSFTVLAEPQLMLPMTEITRIYSLRNNVSMLTAFDDSVEQEMKLLDGEPGDVLITSYPVVITDLRQRGLIDVYSQANVAADKLVLAAVKSENRDTRSELMIALSKQPLLLANSTRYIEGLYGLDIAPYMYYGQPSNIEPVEYNMRSTLYEMVSSNQGIGLLLESEAKRIEEIDLIVPVNQSNYPPIMYQAFAVAGENMPIARAFIEFLGTQEAQNIFQRHGFNQP